MAKSSLNTYQSGLTAWDQFAAEFNIPADVFQLDSLAIHMTVEYFACFLRSRRHVKPSTINEYITHVATNARERGLPDTTTLRSTRLHYILESFTKADARAIPQRLSIKIPLTADLLWRLENFIDKHFPNSPIATLYKAAFSLGFLIGPRPREYLKTPTRHRTADCFTTPKTSLTTTALTLQHTSSRVVIAPSSGLQMTPSSSPHHPSPFPLPLQKRFSS